ncbi:hypothetical protein EMCRGX_G002854 [Ephydatia muelleri]
MSFHIVQRFSVLVDDSCAIISSVGDMVIIKTCSFDVPGTGCTVYQYVSPKMFSIKRRQLPRLLKRGSMPPMTLNVRTWGGHAFLLQWSLMETGIPVERTLCRQLTSSKS